MNFSIILLYVLSLFTPASPVIEITYYWCDDWSRTAVLEYHADSNETHTIQISEDGVAVAEYTRSDAEGFSYIFHHAPSAERVRIVIVGANTTGSTVEMLYCLDDVIFVPLVSN